MMSHSRILAFISSSRQMMMAWKVSGLSHRLTGRPLRKLVHDVLTINASAMHREGKYSMFQIGVWPTEAAPPKYTAAASCLYTPWNSAS
jgi:hypothetical protein